MKKKKTTSLKGTLTPKQLESLKVNAKTLSEFFDVCERMTRRYAQSLGMPRYGLGKYTLLDCVEWYDERWHRTPSRVQMVRDYYLKPMGK